MHSLKKLIPYLKPYRSLILASTLLAIPLALLRAAPAKLIETVIRELKPGMESSKVLQLAGLVIGLFALNFPVRFFHYYFLRIVIVRVNQKIKSDLYRHLLGLSADHFTKNSTGTLISRAGYDPDRIDAGISCINIIIREPATFLILFGYACYLDWKLTLLTIGVVPALAWVFSSSGKHLKRYIGRMTEENAKLFSNLQETFTGIRIVKAFNLENYIREKFEKRVDDFARFALKTAAVEEAAHPAVELITAFVIALVVYYGGIKVLHGEMAPEQILAFFAAIALMMNPIRLLNEVNMKLNQASAASDRVFEMMTWKTHILEPENPVPLTHFNDALKLENVSFSYPDAPERTILKNVSLTLKKGQTIALAGESGAGKSSLISLIPRIFDPISGRITIDGIDIKNFRLQDLRQLIAVVSQDVFLFNDTIEENIRCGHLSATHEEIEEAAKRAHAMDFIKASPQGFMSIIGDRGQKLSGGERQRISIARAFLRKSPILILDEATSNLDTASEKSVQEALQELMQNRTTLIIAHRLSTIKKADKILVLKSGEIVESGTHEELLEKSGEYHRFQSHQS